MTWAAPNADAVTLGEMDGELLSVSPRDEAHVGDAFARRGGAVFPPARVVSSKARRPFGQQASLTRELDDDARAVDAGAVRLARQATAALRSFLLDDEQQVLRVVAQTLRATASKLLAGASSDADADDSDAEREGADAAADVDERFAALGRRMSTTSSSGRVALGRSDESIAAMSWHPTLSLLAVAQRDGVVAFYDVGSATWDARVLEHEAQEEITNVEWAKFSGGTIAVACRCVECR